MAKLYFLVILSFFLVSSAFLQPFINKLPISYYGAQNSERHGIAIFPKDGQSDGNSFFILLRGKMVGQPDQTFQEPEPNILDNLRIDMLGLLSAETFGQIMSQTKIQSSLRRSGQYHAYDNAISYLDTKYRLSLEELLLKLVFLADSLTPRINSIITKIDTFELMFSSRELDQSDNEIDASKVVLKWSKQIDEISFLLKDLVTSLHHAVVQENHPLKDALNADNIEFQEIITLLAIHQNTLTQVDWNVFDNPH